MEEQNKWDGTETVILEEAPKKAVQTGEIRALRGENSKVYRMSDGTEQAVFYASSGTLETEAEGTEGMQTYSWIRGTMYSASAHVVGTEKNNDPSRMYLKLKLPTLPGNPRIKKAELKLYQESGTVECNTCPKFGLYQVEGEIAVGNHTPTELPGLIDYDTLKCGTDEDGERISYTFDITKLIDAVNKGESASANLVLRMLDESAQCNDSVVLGSHRTSYAPQLLVTYESGYGVNTSYRTHTHELGRFGQGSVDLACGNLMFESEDFAWAGNRMPVTLKHLYNSALGGVQYTGNEAVQLNAADFSAMKIGNGFKLNVMQSMRPAAFRQEGTAYTGYVYVGENGEESYFKQSTKKECCESNTHCYYLYEEVSGSGMYYDPVKRILSGSGETHVFDTAGRLIRETDEYGNHRVITYVSGRITAVKDGAGRRFGFTYNTSGFLTAITAPDGTKIQYTYEGNLLRSITYPNGKKAELVYTSGLPSQVILSENGTARYKVEYAFQKNRLASVTEYGAENGSFVKGMATSYDYAAASRRTIVQTTEAKDEGETADSVVKTVYAFDDDGTVVSQYVYTEETGNVGSDGKGSGIHPHAGEGGAGIVSNINNLLKEHHFESLEAWSGLPGNSEAFQVSCYQNEDFAKYGKSTCWLRTSEPESGENGIYQTTQVLPAGSYTFSAYVQIDRAFSGGTHPGVYLRVTDSAGTVLAERERLTEKKDEYIRLITPFELSTAKSVQVRIQLSGAGSVSADAAQLENNPFANAYNMLENGNFERGTECWDVSQGVSCTEETVFNMSKALKMEGNLQAERNACQTVTVKTRRSTRERFTLSGWAKGYGIVNRERVNAKEAQFRLRAVVRYYDMAYGEYQSETYTADFCPCTEEWQFASVEFAKEKYRMVQDVKVYCDYGYNYGEAVFDDIQLIRNEIETNLSTSDFTVEGTGEDDAAESVSTETKATPSFEEAKNSFGNLLTETTFTDGEFGTIYKAFGYDGTTGDLIRETDARGENTQYTVNANSARNEEITDRMGNRTAYTYDNSGRTTKVTSKKADGSAIADVSYAYDGFDNLTEIVRGDGLKYVLSYNAFHNLESIGVEGKQTPLIRYTYRNGNGRLKQLEYANGDKMKAVYNSIGQMISEKWYDKNETMTAYYRYVYDGTGNIVRSIDFKNEKEYAYLYEGGNIIRATESNITVGTNESITAKHLVNSIWYEYDGDGQIRKKRIVAADGEEQAIYYEHPENKNTVTKLTIDGKTVTSHSKTDSFGRKSFDELQLGTGFISREFHYHAGEVTEEHKANEKLKSSPTTQLVSRIVYADGRTLSYEYDAEERITKVTDSANGTTEYTYDALGQLVTEKRNGVVVNEMVYDSYGNITKKNGVVYTYGDTKWKDLLTKVGSKTITYDAQGNPTSYLGHTLMWEKGRQLKKYDSNTYTYNANGIRTSKTVGGVKHTYVLDGTKILRETWGGNRLIPLYDNEESVCGIRYNDETYYFEKNLQGDVTGIVDAEAQKVAAYRYDAWGACEITEDSTAIGIAEVNPYRYRGYYYDSEIGMYYLQSRYYDPSVGRFVNADEVELITIIDLVNCANLFIYCGNDSVGNIDLTGNFKIKLTDLQGTYKGRWACINAIINLILTTTAVTYAFFSFGSSVIKIGVAGQVFSVNLASWVTTPMILGGMLLCTGTIVYAVYMAAMIITAITYKVKYNRFTIKKGWGWSLFSYKIQR